MREILTIGLVFICVLAGCRAVKFIGATPVEDHNKLVEEVQTFSKESMENQATIGMVTVDLAQENILEAKQNNDEPKLERSIETKVKAQQATKEANRLSETEYSKAEEFDFNGWLDILTGILSAMFPVLGGYLVMIRSQLGRVKDKAKTFATSPQTFDISQDKDLK